MTSASQGFHKRPIENVVININITMLLLQNIPTPPRPPKRISLLNRWICYRIIISAYILKTCVLVESQKGLLSIVSVKHEHYSFSLRHNIGLTILKLDSSLYKSIFPTNLASRHLSAH